MANWTATTLGRCANWLSGGTPSKARPEFWTGAIPWISAKDMKSFRLYDSEDHISTMAIGQGGKLVPSDTVLILVRGMTLHSEVPICLTTRQMAFNQDIKALVPVDNVNSAFLAYWLLANKSNLLATVEHAGHGTGKLTTDRLKEKVVLLPPPDEQEAITSILGALDDKIELNRRMNATLEAMARALFQSWFVDLDPVRAKLDGRPPVGLDPAIAEFFPVGLQDSELGPIPRGWGVTNVRQCTAALFDGPHATPQPSDTGPIFLGISNFRSNSLDFSTTKRIHEDDFLRWTRRVLPQEGDIVFTYEAALGLFARIPPGIRCCLGRRIALVRPLTERKDGCYLFHWFISNPFQEYLRRHQKPGSTVDRIWLTEFPNFPVLEPPLALTNRFEEVGANIWAQINANEHQSRTLAALRDTLLPKLLSGELSVKNLESQVAAVV